MPVFTLPTPHPLRAPPVDPTDVIGEDVRVRNGYEIGPHGDWITCNGAELAMQSVRREGVANVGALVRRPTWGVGISAAIFKPMTKTLSDDLVAKLRRQTTKNPRVQSVIDVSTFSLPATSSGTAIAVQYVAAGSQKPTTTVFKPEGR